MELNLYPGDALFLGWGEVGALLHKNFERIQGSAAAASAQEEPLS